MRKNFVTLCAVFFIGMSLVQHAHSKRRVAAKGCSGWRPDSQYNLLISTQTVETVSGEIIRIGTFVPYRGMAYGVYFLLQTKKGAENIHVGPGWYIENQDIMLEKGDKVSVRGSRIKFKKESAIAAFEIRRAKQTLRLRDRRGYPYWYAWR